MPARAKSASNGYTIWTPKRERVFLEALREHGNVRAACEAANVAKMTAYTRRKDVPAFAAAWDDALDDACDELEAVARQRAKDVSDTLLMFLLRAHRPEKFSEKVRNEHTGEQKLIVRYERDWRGANSAETEVER